MVLVCTVMAFIFFAFGPDNIFVGIALLVMGAICAIVAMVFMAKHIELQNEQKENRLSKLESEIDSLKNKLR